jgi:hypothetical protein
MFRMRAMAWSLASVFLAVAFSGCVLPDFLGDSEPGTSPIMKKAVLTIDSDDMDGERFSDYLKVSFSYVHEGSSASSSSVTFDFFDEDGKQRSRPASQYTSKGSIESGDIVVVTGVNITSGLVVRQGEKVPASCGAQILVHGRRRAFAGRLVAGGARLVDDRRRQRHERLRQRRRPLG